MTGRYPDSLLGQNDLGPSVVGPWVTRRPRRVSSDSLGVGARTHGPPVVPSSCVTFVSVGALLGPLHTSVCLRTRRHRYDLSPRSDSPASGRGLKKIF